MSSRKMLFKILSYFVIYKSKLKFKRLKDRNSVICRIHKHGQTKSGKFQTLLLLNIIARLDIIDSLRLGAKTIRLSTDKSPPLPTFYR